MRHLLAALIVVLVAMACADARADAVDFRGKYIGYGYVYGQDGTGVRTDFRVSVEQGDGGTFVIELNYLDGKAAKFTKAARGSDYALMIDESVKTGSPKAAVAEGKLYTADGAAVSGSIVVRPADDENAKPLSTIRFFVSRLKESPSSF